MTDQSAHHKLNPIDGAEMIYIPAGDFLMGEDDQSDNPRRTVSLESYWIYKYPVTVAQYKKYCAATGETMSNAPKWGWKDDHPMVNVNWHDCQKYCEWASVRLAIEAEWEKAARGTNGQNYPWGNEFDETKLWSTADTSRKSTCSVVRKSFFSVSPYGLVDMAGNVWQWCQEEFDGSDDARVQRGGSWLEDYEEDFRSSYRYSAIPDFVFPSTGFRCVVGD